MTNKSRTLYTGITNDLERRVYEHKQKLVPGFTAKYNIDRLVYFEATQDVHAAISREKQIKGWLRAKKIALIESMNPEWGDLSVGWFSQSGDAATTTEILRLRMTPAQNNNLGKNRR
jgi:putative endonuclease